MDVTKIKQNPNVIDYCFGDFVDYKGDTHVITVVAYDIAKILEDVDADGYGFALGVAIQNPLDEFVEVIGVNRAAKQVEKSNGKCPIVCGSFKGVLDDSIVSKFIWNEFDYVVNNINLYIKGYNDSKKKYEARRTQKDLEIIDEI